MYKTLGMCISLSLPKILFKLNLYNIMYSTFQTSMPYSLKIKKNKGDIKFIVFAITVLYSQFGKRSYRLILGNFELFVSYTTVVMFN